jgi:hypothetical protein
VERDQLDNRHPHGGYRILSHWSRSQVEAGTVAVQIGGCVSLINTNLIKHPMNWVTILLMLIIAGIFGHLLLSLLDQEPTSRTISVPAGLPASYSPNQ